MQEELEGKKQAGDYIHLEDMSLKTAANFFGNEVLMFLGIPEEMKAVAPTEFIHLDARQMYQDFNYIMEGGEWYHFEFESDSITIDDLRRFREYEAVTSRVHKLPVTTFVICSSRVHTLRSELTEGINTYKVKVIRLKDNNADELFTELEKKKCLKKKDLIPVLLTPLMAGEMPQKERIRRGLEMLKKDYEDVTGEDKIRMQAVMYSLAVKVLNKKELREVKEEFGMTILGEMLFNDGMERGMEKGIERGRGDMLALVSAMVSDGFADEIPRLQTDPAFLQEMSDKYHTLMGK